MRYVLAILLPPAAALVYGGFGSFLINILLCIASFFLSNPGFMILLFFPHAVESVLADPTNIFPFLHLSFSPNLNIAFFPLLAVGHAIMVVINHDRDQKKAKKTREEVKWQAHQELKLHSQLETRKKAEG